MSRTLYIDYHYIFLRLLIISLEIKIQITIIILIGTDECNVFIFNFCIIFYTNKCIICNTTNGLYYSTLLMLLLTYFINCMSLQLNTLFYLFFALRIFRVMQCGTMQLTFRGVKELDFILMMN